MVTCDQCSFGLGYDSYELWFIRDRGAVAKWGIELDHDIFSVWCTFSLCEKGLWNHIF